MSKSPYIDVHSHKFANKWSIQNVDQRNFIVPDGLFSIGLHPWFLTPSNFKKNLINLDNRLDHAIAIGECGLDKICTTDWDLQKEVFISQILLSEKHQKPLIIHCVKSFNEIMEYKQHFQPKMPWIIHGFNKKNVLLERLIEKGFYISLGNKIIQDENWVADISKVIPIEKLFFETDDSVVPIEDVYSTYSKIIKIDISILKNQILKNFKKVFRGA